MKSWMSGFVRSGPHTVRGAKSARPSQNWCGMALVLGVLLAPTWANAQSAQGLFWQCGVKDGQPMYCPTSNQFPLPGGPAINALTAVTGTQRGTAIAAATGMTIPATATVALVQFQGTNNASGQCAFWQDDGTNPTASAGQASPAYTPIWIKASAAFKAIAATGATCTMTVSYYK